MIDVKFPSVLRAFGRTVVTDVQDGLDHRAERSVRITPILSVGGETARHGKFVRLRHRIACARAGTRAPQMAARSSSPNTLLQQLAADAASVTEFEAEAENVLAARLGAELAHGVVNGLIPPSLRPRRRALAIDAATMVGMCRDFLAVRQKQLAGEQRAEARDAFSRLLLESAGEGIFGIDRDGRCTFINAEGLRLLGFDHQAQVLGENMHHVVHHTRADGSPYPVSECAIFDAHREGRRVERDDEVLFRRDGSSFPVEYRSNPVLRAGQVEGSVLTFTDITERRGTEAALEQSRSLQQMAGGVARLGGWSVDVARQEVVWSDELYDIVDHPREDQPQLGEALRHYRSADQHRVEHALEQCAATGVPFDIEARLESYGGRQMWVRVIGRPRHDADGAVTHIDGALQDIDELKASRRVAEELSERLTATLESITDAFLTVDRDWRMAYVNRRAEALLCRRPDELVGANLWDSFPEAVGGVLDDIYHRVMRTGTSEVIEEFHWHALDIWLDIDVHASDQGLAVYFRDVSEQRKIRLELREREARMVEQAALLDKARDAILVRDLDHRVTYWNHSAERLYGYRAEEALGTSLRDLIINDDARFDQANTALLDHGEWVGETRDVAKDGSMVITEAHWTLVRDEEGRPTSVLSIKSDVTERRRIEEQLLRTQRLESLGTLAGGIAHDLNNVLAPILLVTQTLQRSEPEQHVGRMLAIIDQSATRGADLVRRVLLFASGIDGEHEEVDLAATVHETTAILLEALPRNIAIDCDVPTSLPPVLGDPTQLHQVLMNLCINARDAMPDGGHLRIGLDVATVGDDAIAHSCPPGRYLTVRVEDTGTGMAPLTLERVFEPFYTTKPHGQGTGLGLPISHGIVRSHGGFIELSSRPGAGSTFVVHLPLAPVAASPPDVVTAAASHRGVGQLLLLIEDEDNLRAMTRLTLEAHGYRVIDAANGRDALPLFAEHAAEIAAVITDMMMPHMDGPTTIRHLLAHTPALPILGLTGLAAGPETARSGGLGIAGVLAKPFSSNHLTAAVARLLVNDS